MLVEHSLGPTAEHKLKTSAGSDAANNGDGGPCPIETFSKYVKTLKIQHLLLELTKFPATYCKTIQFQKTPQRDIVRPYRGSNPWTQTFSLH